MKYYAKCCGRSISCEPSKNINWRGKRGSKDTYYGTDKMNRIIRGELYHYQNKENSK